MDLDVAEGRGGGGGGEGGIIGLSHIVKKDTQAECGKYTCSQNVW